MGPLNELMNKVDGWCQLANQAGEPQGVLVRYGVTRAVSVLGCAPLEIGAVAQNAVYGFAQGIALPFQVLSNTFSWISGSECCDFISRGKSTIELVSDLLATVYKVAAYAIGTASTVILGFAAPAANLSIHSRAGIFENRREVALAVLNAQKAKELDEAELELWKQNLIAQREADEAAQKAEQEKQEAAQLEQARIALEAAAKEQQAIEAAKQAEIEAAKKSEEERLALEAAKQADTQASVNTAQTTTPVADAVGVIDDATVNDDVIVQTKPSKWRFANPLFYLNKILNAIPQIRKNPQAT